METNIVFIHFGNPDYLKYSLKQAKASNPDATIHLIGDHTNNVYKSVKHHNIEDYFQSASEFEKIYQHRCRSGIRQILFAFQRWFILNEFVISNGINKCLIIDSDVMIYCDVEKEFERLKQYDFTLGDTRHTGKAMCPSPIYWNNLKALDEFCTFVMNIYTGKDKENYDKMISVWKEHFSSGGAGGICDMTMYAFFVKCCSFQIGFVDDIVDGTTYDLNLTISVNGLFEYQMENGVKKPEWIEGIKKLEWINNCPYGFELKSGKKIRFKMLHCCGMVKKLIKGFCRND